MKTSQHTIEARKRHHKALEELATSLSCDKWEGKGLQLWRKLRGIEYQAHQASVDYCNGVITIEQMDSIANDVKLKVARVFGGNIPPRFYVNYDGRGAALKLEPSDDGNEPATKFALHQDWGRNQILAPEIN